jgi:protein-L-isoaspartate O-methyltransferase
MENDFQTKISLAYSQHPLTAARIIKRIYRRKNSLDGLTEMDLAVDEETMITDQNHIGGVEAVQAIAEAIELREGESVLDIGTGLGGTPRVLAYLYGCRCYGVELVPMRHRDAIELTRLVGLQRLVTFTCGNFLTVEATNRLYNLIIGQNAFMHFPDHRKLLHKCSGLLKPGGWLAVEEGYLRRAPSGEEETRNLNILFDCWNGQFYKLSAWKQWLNEVGLTPQRIEDLSESAEQHFRGYVRLKEAGRLESVSESELLGWRLGVELSTSGLIGMFRLLVRKLPTEA